MKFPEISLNFPAGVLKIGSQSTTTNLTVNNLQVYGSVYDAMTFSGNFRRIAVTNVNGYGSGRLISIDSTTTVAANLRIQSEISQEKFQSQFIFIHLLRLIVWIFYFILYKTLDQKSVRRNFLLKVRRNADVQKILLVADSVLHQTVELSISQPLSREHSLYRILHSVIITLGGMEVY